MPDQTSFLDTPTSQLKAIQVKDVLNGKMEMVSQPLKGPTVLLRTACSITVSGEEMSDS